MSKCHIVGNHMSPLICSFLFCRSELACKIALDATSTVALEENGKKEIDIKRYAKVEKVCMFFRMRSSLNHNRPD